MGRANPSERWGRLRAALHGAHLPLIVGRANCIYVGGDSRTILHKLPSDSIDCTITSPPYAQLKDYGSQNQIGFGQDSDAEYLEDIRRVLSELHRVGRRGSALWVVLDTVKKSGKTLVLPWEVIRKATAVGWTFEDLVIWDKGRGLPWSHVGHLRGIFEYVLLLSKGGLARFDINAARETDHLSRYWVKYPERYHPEGKAPTDIWHFPIPVQGSWSRNGIRHQCPLPLPMIARMIALSTTVGDTVLDPFAGTGSVLAAATFLARHGIGIDVNRKFVRLFGSQGYDSLKAVASNEIHKPGSGGGATELAKLIVDLRSLKFPKTLFVQLSRPDRLGKAARNSIAGFLAMSSRSIAAARRSGVVGRLRLLVLAQDGADLDSLREAIRDVQAVPPLSKFGLDARVTVVSWATWTRSRFTKALPRGKWHRYVSGVFYSVSGSVDARKLRYHLSNRDKKKPSGIPPIISQVAVNVSPEVQA